MLIATAGHVDHGKTTLIHALTGVDTDRLPEEKKRGLTIELGFAYLQDAGSDDLTLGFIDVPGHEKFIRNMIVGVAAIDLALLVVAADDGVMPQTREHVAILDLLGISHCLIAITRVDLVTPEKTRQVAAQIEQLLGTTALKCEGSLAVCAPEQRGIAELKAELFAVARRLRNSTLHSPLSAQQYFRLAVDRCFTVQGAGTVVTGAVVAGTVTKGETVRLLPAQKAARVREVHANGAAADGAATGQRASLNLANIDIDDVSRGDWITSMDMTVISSCLDVAVRVLEGEDRPLRHWTPVHIHAGAQNSTGRVALYGQRNIPPGDNCLAQLVTDKPLHLLFADRFIIRDQSATRTIGGGQVIDPFSSRTKRFRKTRLPILKALNDPDHDRALLAGLAHSTAGLIADSFRQGRNIAPEAFQTLLERSGVFLFNDSSAMQRLLSHKTADDASSALISVLKSYHRQQPESLGIEEIELKQRTALALPVFDYVIDTLIRRGEIARSGSRLKLSDFVATLNAADQLLLDQVLKSVGADVLKPPALAELAVSLKIERTDLIQQAASLEASGYLIRVSQNRFYHPDALAVLAQMVCGLADAADSGGFSAREFRDRSGIGRNLAIDVLEYFDRTGLTRRVGDHRTLSRSTLASRKQQSPADNLTALCHNPRTAGG